MLFLSSQGRSPTAFAPFGGTWGPRGILFADYNSGLWLVPESGQPQPFAQVDQASGELRIAFPSYVPDGRVLAVSTRNDRRWALVAVGETRRATLLTVSDESLLWPVLAGPRTVLFERQGANTGIWRIDVSADLASAQGAPIPVFPDGSSPSVSADDMLVALSGRRYHPNIAGICGLEKTPECTALVIELIEGEDLSQRIARRPPPDA